MVQTRSQAADQLKWGPPPTMAQRAHDEDLKLRRSSSSAEKYEERKSLRDEERRLQREAFMQAQPTFHKFQRLPTELRLQVWERALEEPTRVTLTVSRRKRPLHSDTDESAEPVEYAATAFLPPLMLVNSESHAVASAHYRRAFRDSSGEHGILAGYPTVLCLQHDVLKLLRPDDLDLVEEFVLEGGDRDVCTDPQFYLDKYATLFSAPNLKRIVAKFHGGFPVLTPLFCLLLQDTFVKTAKSHPNLREPELVLELSNYRATPGGKMESRRLRGNLLGVPNQLTYE